MAASDRQADERPDSATSTNAEAVSDTQKTPSRSAATDAISEAEQQQIRELQARDREVRAHEQAHLAAAGQYAKGGIQYDFDRGPDGRLYAVGGQVSVDTSEIAGDPQATLLKAQTLQRAALAPAEPSSQDRAVAAEMVAMAAEARQDISTQRSEKAAAAAESTASASEGSPDQKSVIENGLGQAESAIDVSTEQGDELASTPLSCPACGGAHSAASHDGMTAYTATPAGASITTAIKV
ncbi:MAG: putative metalloprotease CJM1_0395 family protein [Pseudomonadota bacterium]